VAALGLILKATRLCNLRCKYCFDWRAGPDQIISFEVLLRTIAAATLNGPTGTITFNWHGGEPTILPIEFYKRALHLQGRFRRPGQQIVNTIQTNATLLDRSWVRFLVENEFAIGVSIDGPPEIHDQVRINQSGHGTYDRVCESITLLRHYGATFAVIQVVDKPTIEAGPDALLDFLVEQEITDVALNFVMPSPTPDVGTVTANYVDPTTMSRFLIGLWDARQTRGLSNIRIRELEAIETSLAGHTPSPCTFAGACFGLVFRVEPNGDVYHCDYFGLDPNFRWGNITTAGFDDFRKSRPMSVARRRERADRDGMSSCPHYAICHGWCPHARRTAQAHASAHNPGCCGLAELVEHMAAHRVPEPRTTPSRRDPALLGLLELA
jgi:uncharacterized protein